MQLSPRLKMIADSIKDVDTVADIGSDHAYVPIYLVLQGRAKRAIASDINRGPVEISKKRICENKASSFVEVRQGSGLKTLKLGEAEAIIIAGMGGFLIRDILQEDYDVAAKVRQLILQPMKDSDALRSWLLTNGFEITDEELVEDEGKIYEVIWAKSGSAIRESVGRQLIGEKIIQKKHPLAGKYIDKKIRELEKIIGALPEGDSQRADTRKAECLELLDYYKEVRKWV